MAVNLPLVSVLMTAYNREKYIAEAIESVLSSTYTNFELIIVDDCSSDNTYTIASHYLKTDVRIKLYKNDFNLGQFANRNKAINLSQGLYIKFLDSDDKIMQNGLELMVKSMLAFPNAGLGVPAKEAFKNNLPYQLSLSESVALHYCGENHLCYGPTGTIFKREAIINVGLFEVKYGILTDTLLNIKIASLYNTVLFENDLFYWRRHDDQVTAEQIDNVRMIRERNLIMKAAMVYEYLPLSKYEVKSIHNNFVKINTLHFFNYLSIGHFKEAFQVKNDTELSLKKIFCAIFNF